MTSGSAPAGEAGTCRLNAVTNCSTLMRWRTFSWATVTTPLRAKFSLPPTWSQCQWVLTRKRIGAPSAATAALILSDKGAYWPSTRNTPSAPADTPMFPPTPISM